jgi:hypothetical protein
MTTDYGYEQAVSKNNAIFLLLITAVMSKVFMKSRDS